MSAKLSVTIKSNQLKKQAESLYGKLGLSLSSAINVFLEQSVAFKGMPFRPRLKSDEYASIPNKDTLKAIKEINNPKIRKKMRSFHSVKDLMRDLND